MYNFIHSKEFIPWWINASVIVFLTIFLSVLGLYIVRKTVSGKALKASHDVAGFTFNIIGLIYGVLLGFMIVSAQNRFSGVEKIIEQEANLLLDLYRNSFSFPEQVRDSIHRRLNSYAKYIINFEWERMSNGDKLEMTTPQILSDLWQDYYNFNPEQNNQKAWYALSIDKLNELFNIRLMRLYSSPNSLGSMMWSFLIIMGIVTIIFMYFFAAESFYSQILMTSLLSGSIAFVLFLIYDLDVVYKGGAQVKPVSFENVLHIFESSSEK